MNDANDPIVDVQRRAVLGTLGAAALVAACGHRAPGTPPATPGTGAAAPAAAAGVLAPPAELRTQGVPPVPMALVERVERYTDFRGHSFADWHPQRREMLVVYRAGDDKVVHIHRLRAPMAPLERLTSGADPVGWASYEPRQGHYIVFARDVGGSEATQLFRLDPETGATTQLTSNDEKHDAVDWIASRGELIVSSAPLDRTAEGGTRSDVTTTLWATDPMRAGSRRVLATLPGGGWFGGRVSPDERSLVLGQYRSAQESQVWLLDLSTGARRQVLPVPGAPQAPAASHHAGAFTPDGKGLWVSSDRVGEFRNLWLFDLESGVGRNVTAHVPWDASAGDASADRRIVASAVNADGRGELRLFDSPSGVERVLPQLPAGSVAGARFHRARRELAFVSNSAQAPAQIHSLDLDTGRVEAWTRPFAPAGIDPTRFGAQTVVRWKSFDGRLISGLLSRPPARFVGRRPVLIDIHGGPEAQARFGFLGRLNFLCEEMGVVVIRPNVRGSSGFGKTFLSLDNGRLREDSVRDISALLDWIATQPELDPARVVVSGGSYGGYMALAVAVHESARIAGAIDDVGISHFVTFLQNTESYRRDLRRVEYGDERDPQMRAFLDRISPLTQAHRITKPLMVVQGKNDPRVPYTEAEQIVERVRRNGVPVWYLRADNEGHGFRRKHNADYRFYAMVMFLEQRFGAA